MSHAAEQPNRTKRSLVALAIAAVTCLVFAGTASADTVTLTLSNSYPTGYSFYNYTGTDGVSHTNVPVAPYPVTLSDTLGIYNNTSAYAICFDINNPSSVGTAYTGAFVNNTDTASMEATYLINQLNLAGMYSASTTVKGILSMAIWQVMFPSSTKTDGSTMSDDPAAQAEIAKAATAVSNGTWTIGDSNKYPTFMPTNTASQRFGIVLAGTSAVVTTYDFASATPEPGSMSLLGLGAGMALMAVRYRNRRKTTAE